MGWIFDNIKIDKHMEILFDQDTICQDEDGNIPINIAYRRVSTEKQVEEGWGLDSQKDKIVEYCKYHRIGACILYTDDGFTGTNLNRPALQAIIQMIQNYNNGLSNVRIDTFIVPRMDRLGRSLLDILQFIENYLIANDGKGKNNTNHNKKDINFVSIKEPFCRIDRNDPSSKLVLQLFASLAEYDRDVLVEKLRNGRDKRIASGKWHGGGITPYGYRYNRETGTLEVIPDEKKKVQEIFRLYTEEKLSPQKIADLLGFKGERIVVQILKRRSLLGYVSVNGAEYKGLHEPLISEDLFNRAQDEMEARSVVRGDPCYLLSGLLYCGICGAKMRYQKWDRKTGECKIICYSQQTSKKYLVKDENCKSKKYWQSEIEQAVIDALFKLSYLNDADITKGDPSVDLTKELEAEIEKERVAINRLYDKYADSAAPDEMLWQKIQERKERKEDLENTLSSTLKKAATVRKIESAKELLRNLKSTWDYMSQPEKQAVCRTLIDKITIDATATLNISLKFKNYLTPYQPPTPHH